MPFQLQAKTVIASATLDLSAVQLEQFAAAAPQLQEVCEGYIEKEVGYASGDVTERPEAVVALDPVMEFLSAVASLVDQTGTIRPKRKIARRKKKAAE